MTIELQFLEERAIMQLGTLAVLVGSGLGYLVVKGFYEKGYRTGYKEGHAEGARIVDEIYRTAIQKSIDSIDNNATDDGLEDKLE